MFIKKKLLGSESGWMEAQLFTEWFSTVFLVSVKHIKDPILLLLDGHASHISPEVIRLAKANNVHMMCFPSNSSHLIQQVDVGLLKPAKTAFRQVVEEDGLNNSFRPISKNIFASLYGKAFLRRHVVVGFEATGMFFLNV
jgi:hypothetical protein